MFEERPSAFVPLFKSFLFLYGALHVLAWVFPATFSEPTYYFAQRTAAMTLSVRSDAMVVTASQVENESSMTSI